MDLFLQKSLEWQSITFDKKTQNEVKKLHESSLKDLKDAFSKNLEFGTGGMRGIMGVGTNRINKYTIGKNTQGLSNYLKQVYPDEQIKAVICYDCRLNSKHLSQVVADVFSANEIQVFLFSDLRPTPELSFALKHLKCHVGIMLTASHNPPEYNGYKVYWVDGGQIVPPQDKAIIEEINKLSFSQINFSSNTTLINPVGEELDNAFIEASISNGKFTNLDKSNLKLVFTPLHGTAIKILPKVLNQVGYDITIIKEQSKPDGLFPTVKSPNPEEPEALSIAIKKAEKLQADLVIGTDPDGDRLGVAVRDMKGDMKLLSGNQTLVIMTKYLLEKYKSTGFKGHEFIASTIVSTPMILKLAKAYGVECKLGLTGFKWIAKMIKDNPNQKFIGGGEESFGYMVGDFLRDKDAITSSLLICEIANEAKHRGSSLYEELLDCYISYGFYWEKLVSVTKKGADGLKEIQQMMNDFRTADYKEIDNSPITWIEDYSASKRRNISTGEECVLQAPTSNVLIFNTIDGSRVCLRPSGTEPKIKFYICVRDTMKSKADFCETYSKAEHKISQIIKQMKLQ